MHLDPHPCPIIAASLDSNGQAPDCLHADIWSTLLRVETMPHAEFGRYFYVWKPCCMQKFGRHFHVWKPWRMQTFSRHFYVWKPCRMQIFWSTLSRVETMLHAEIRLTLSRVETMQLYTRACVSVHTPVSFSGPYVPLRVSPPPPFPLYVPSRTCLGLARTIHVRCIYGVFG